MNTIDVKLEQNRRDQERLKEELSFLYIVNSLHNSIVKEMRLLAEKKKKEGFKNGDIVTCLHGKRVILYGDDGNLAAYSKGGQLVTLLNSFYTKTGQNIFTDNVLHLNY
jgi:hypothetical protein